MAVISVIAQTFTLNHLTDFVANSRCKVSENRKHEKKNSKKKNILYSKKISNSTQYVLYLTANLESHCVCSYLDCAEKLAAANIAASTSTLS